MIGAPVAGQLFRDLRCALATPGVAQQGSLLRVPFAADDRAENGHPRGAVHLRHRPMHPDVHFGVPGEASLLHAEWWHKLPRRLIFALDGAVTICA